jgi:hypothetical protein
MIGVLGSLKMILLKVSVSVPRVISFVCHREDIEQRQMTEAANLMRRFVLALPTEKYGYIKEECDALKLAQNSTAYLSRTPISLSHAAHKILSSKRIL